MNKIYKYILSIAAVLAFVPMGFAQEYYESNGIAYKKAVSDTPDENGNYWINLEAFVTGEVKIINESIPADVVLVLDLSSSMDDESYGSYSTRTDALKAAVIEFMRTFADNDLYTTKDGVKTRRTDSDGNPTSLGNKLAIVKFNGSSNSDNTVDLLDGFLSPSADSTTIKTKVNAMTTSTGTRTDYGMQMAKNLLAGIASTQTNTTKAVVLFTDGCPSTSGSTNFNGTYAVSAISQAYTIKQTYGASVYSVGLIKGLSGQTLTNVNNMMEYISSDYPKAVASYSNSVLSLTSGTKESEDFFQDATKSDLSDIFKSIASSAGGSDAEIGSSSIVAVDVVSTSFSLPEGADASSILLYTAHCTGKSGDYLTFEDESNWKQAPGGRGTYTYTYTDDDGVEHTETINIDADVAVSVSGNKISTSGFNFGALWCGDHTGNGDYDGYKLIIKIPITINEDAVGGPAVFTNDAGSGIYITDEDGNTKSVATFNRPTLKVPVQLWIMKSGMEKGESAKFTVSRRLASDPDVDASYKFYTTVVLTGGNDVTITRSSDGEELTGALVKLIGLDPDYYYKIVEEDWSWSYSFDYETANTSEGIEVNPFVIANTKKDTDVNHAEAKVTNTFGTSYGKKTVNTTKEAE